MTDMRCPKCGSDKVKTPWAIQKTHHCWSCNNFFTDWQQAEIDRLHVIEQCHSLCGEVIDGLKEENEQIKTSLKDAEEALRACQNLIPFGQVRGKIDYYFLKHPSGRE